MVIRFPQFALHYLNHALPDPQSTSLGETLALIVKKHSGAIPTKPKNDFDFDVADFSLNPLALVEDASPKQPLYLSKKERLDQEQALEREAQSNKTRLQEALLLPALDVYSGLAWNPDPTSVGG